MKLKIYRNLWGMCGPRRELIGKLEEAGYDGIEAVLFSDEEARELGQILPERRLLFKAVLWPTGRSVAEQLGSLRAQLTRALSLEPASISVIGGEDKFDDGWGGAPFLNEVEN